MQQSHWQLKDWPGFQWNGPRLRRAEDEFLVRAGRLQGIAQRLRLIQYEEMLAQILSEEAVSSSQIEGEAVLPEKVLKSIRRPPGLEQGEDDAGPSERGVSEMAVAASQGLRRAAHGRSAVVLAHVSARCCPGNPAKKIAD